MGSGGGVGVIRGVGRWVSGLVVIRYEMNNEGYDLCLFYMG